MIQTLATILVLFAIASLLRWRKNGGTFFANSNEVSVTCGFSAAKNGVAMTASASLTKDLTGNIIFQNVQNVGTATEAIDLGEAAFVPAYIFLKNLDPTNYVEIGLNTPLTQILIKLLPGQFTIFPSKVSAIYGLANTAACNLQVAAVEA